MLVTDDQSSRRTISLVSEEMNLFQSMAENQNLFSTVMFHFKEQARAFLHQSSRYSADVKLEQSTPSFKNYVNTVESNVLTFCYIVPPDKAQLVSADVDQPRMAEVEFSSLTPWM
jgi:hypothetical protein